MQQNLICTYDLSVKTHWACSTYLFLGQVLQVIIIEAFTPPSSLNPASGQLYPKFKGHFSPQHTIDVETLILVSPEQQQGQLTVLMVWTVDVYYGGSKDNWGIVPLVLDGV